VGASAEPTVRPGDKVRCGDPLGLVPEGKLGADVHASIGGRVETVTPDHVVIVS
jgi:Na+-translocating ferredoxin:NAD+ oxidoreductase RnfC subunit